MNSFKGPEIYRGNCGEKECACDLLDDLEVLRRSPVFAGVPLEVVKLLALFSKRRVYENGELVIRQGDTADRAFLVLRGEVEVFEQYKGRQFSLQILGRMGFFGELALLAEFEWFFNVQALNEVELISIDRDSFQKVITKFPDIQYAVTERIVQLRIKRLKNQMRYLLDNIKDEALRENAGNRPRTMIA